MSKSYLVPGTGADGTQLWEVTVNDDGTASSHEVVDLYPKQKASAFNETPHFTAFGNGFLFVAGGIADESNPGNAGYGNITSVADGGTVTGQELWYTDGTAAGTHLVYDAFQGTSGFGPNGGMSFYGATITTLQPGVAVFVDQTAPQGVASLFETDGTVVTQLTGGNVNQLLHVTDLGATVLFTANIGSGRDDLSHAVYVSDGTVNGTHRISTETGSQGFTTFTNSSGKVEALFTGSDHQLWVTDGTTTTELTAASGGVASICDLGGSEVAFFGTSSQQAQLYVTDGTPGGTRIIENFGPGSGVSNVQLFANAHRTSEILFEAYESGSYGLWVTDGTSGGTKQISTIPGSITTEVASEQGVFLASTNNSQTYLTYTDGTAAGTVELAQDSYIKVYAGPAGGSIVEESQRSSLGPIDTTLFFINGTLAGTHAITTSAQYYFTHLTSIDGLFFFSANEASETAQLFVVGASGDATQLNLNGDSDATGFSVLDGELFFQASKPGGGTETWVTDGTQAGTHLCGIGSINTGNGTYISPPLPCFLAGTRLRTPSGDRKVETLREGDLVLTERGEAAAIRWVGRSPFDTTRHPRPRQVAPIRIRRGAFAVGVPARDLLVSPGHALLVDGVLMQAERLVNGATIIRDTTTTTGTYFHVELDRHDILLSNNLPSESFLDTGNRSAFVNGGAFADLHPDFSPRHRTETCRPLVQDGAPLAAARARLIARARALGWAATHEAQPRVLAGGSLLQRIGGEGTWIHVAVPPGAASVRLVSHSGVPAELVEGSTDTRRLGLWVDGVAIVRHGVRHELTLDDAALGQGWHGIEGAGAWRRTDGEAAIALEGPCELRLSIGCGMGAWRAPNAQIARAA